jgi:hypothetical protein
MYNLIIICAAGHGKFVAWVANTTKKMKKYLFLR